MTSRDLSIAFNNWITRRSGLFVEGILLTLTQNILDGTADAATFGELLADGALLVKRPSHLLCRATKGALSGELLADWTLRVEHALHSRYQRHDDIDHTLLGCS